MTASAQSSQDYYKYRTYDGTFNDLSKEEEGKAGTYFLRKRSANYSDDINTMVEGPNPRALSNLFCSQEETLGNKYGLSSLVFTFLQFIDHDLTFSEGGGDFAPIVVPQGDPQFDPLHTGMVVIPFSRSATAEGTGTSRHNPRQHVNGITPWLDGSMVYGSDEARAKWLRSGECGKLKVSSSSYGDLLPCNTANGECDQVPDENAPHMDMDKDHSGTLRLMFVAGDTRANEQPGLTALHTLFLREHNRICDKLIASGKCDDEANYQYARKMVGGVIQSIMYNELGPILGLSFGSSSYRRSASPQIFNSFASAAFRLGHTMVSDVVPIVSDECGEDRNDLSLAEGFFNPTIIMENGPGAILRGLNQQEQEEMDLQLVSSIRNFLFGPPGAGGLDLAALNIQRGRDHGIPYYNQLRTHYGLSKVRRFSQITNNRELQDKLETAYGSVDKIEAWVGMLAEDHRRGSIFGSTIQRIVSRQFQNIRRADRFYYSRDRSIARSDRNEISRTTLADIIHRNSTVNNMFQAFYTGSCQPDGEVEYCDVKARNTKYEWISKVGINGGEHDSGRGDGYSDYTSISLPISDGTNSITLEAGNKYLPFKKLWRVWIDLNKDGEFSDSEMVFTKVSRRAISDHFSINAEDGVNETRMRVMMSLFRFDDPCHNIQYGEVEDYTVSFDGVGNATTLLTESRSPVQLEEEEMLIAFPNPTTEYIAFNGINKEKQGTFAILNTLGQVMRSGSTTTMPVQMSVNNWSAGAYTVIVNYRSGDRQLARFVVKN